MSWYMPSYGRPERLRTMLEAPGGWPDKVHVLINADDPEYQRYQQVFDGLLHEHMERKRELAPWVLHTIPAGSRCADAHRWISEQFPYDDFYGLLCDDHWPITPEWHETLVWAAGKAGISTPNGEPSFPKLRNALVIGGELARAMGSLVPAPVKHNYEDNIWDTIAADFGILAPRPEIVVEHRHHIHGSAKVDKTYERGSHDIHQDREIFQEWLQSSDRWSMYDRIGPVTGRTISVLDPSNIHLAILTPMQDDTVDVAYHMSLQYTLTVCNDRRIPTSVRQTTGGSHIGKAREAALWTAYYNDPKVTHFLMIDADMGWDPHNVLRLLACGHDFCGIVGVRKQDELRLCANFLPNPQKFHPKTAFMEVQDIGGAFVMVTREAIDRMIEAYPELEYEANGRREWALWLDMIDKGWRLSEDLAFCRRWRAIGGEIWIDPQASLIHAGRKQYTGSVSEIFKLSEAPDAPAAESAAA